MKNTANITRNLITAIILLVLLPITAFSAENEEKPQEKTAPPSVVVTLKPIHSMVASVMGELGTPTLLIDKKNSGHDYTLKPSDMKKMQKADVIFFTSMDLETFLVNAIPSLTKGTVTVELAASEGVTRQPVASSESDGHRHSAYDPHIWLSPQNAIAMVKQINKILATRDKKNRGIYEMNAKNYINKISAASEKITLELSPYKNVPFITFHDAYGYFVKSYGLNQTAAVSLNPELPLGAERISDINNLIKIKHVYCVFADPAFDNNSIKKILNNPDRVKIGSLDPIGLNIPAGENAYVKILESVSSNLLSCFANDGN